MTGRCRDDSSTTFTLSSVYTSSSEEHELRQLPVMDRVKRLFEPTPAYLPIDSNPDEDDQDDELTQAPGDNDAPPFSRLEYFIFLLLGVAMLWAWNMFLAAAPYFQSRFESSPWILDHFQAAEVSVSAATNMVSMIILSKLQENASYPFRISSALAINAICFTILALSTLVHTSATVYFGFLLVVIFFSSLSTGLIQNGIFAFVSGFGRGEYTQAIMTGQAVAGVLPPLAQIVSVLLIPKHDSRTGAQSQSPKSAFIYFITATAISVIALLAFFHLLRRQSETEAMRSAKSSAVHDSLEAEGIASSHLGSAAADRTPVGLWTLFRKLPFLTAGVFVCFAGTLLGFPVFTASILSNSGINSAVFIPTAFLTWNIGDLLGRLITISPKLSLTHYPFALFSISMARLGFVPLYLLCNIKGRGAVVPSDFFYLIVVQLLFGLSNGYIGSSCMMGASEWVQPEEREAAGGFMGLALVSGLTVGSLLSFLLGSV